MLSVQMSAVLLVWIGLPAEMQQAVLALFGVAPSMVPGVLAVLTILGRLIDQPKVRQ